MPRPTHLLKASNTIQIKETLLTSIEERFQAAKTFNDFVHGFLVVNRLNEDDVKNQATNLAIATRNRGRNVVS